MRAPSVTRLLIWSLIAVFVCQLFQGGPGYFYPSGVDLRLGLSQGGVARGQWWSFLTYAWLHSEKGWPWHILWNVLWLNLLGSTLEGALGKRRFLGLYAASVLGAALAWFLFASSRNGLLMGASGAIFGMMAGYARLEGSGMLMRLAVASFFRVAVGFEIACLLFGWLPGIAHWAHLGGAFGGWWFMRVFVPKATGEGGGSFFKTSFRTGTPAGEPRQPQQPPGGEEGKPEREIPVDDGLFSNYHSKPQDSGER